MDGHDVSVGLLQRQQHVAGLLAPLGDAQKAGEVPIGVWPREDVHELLALQKLRLQPLCHATWTTAPIDGVR